MAEEETLLPDQWLEQHLQPGADSVCLRGHLEVYFPMTHPRAVEQYHRLVDTIASTFGGATVWTGKGAWCPAEVPCRPHELEQENVWVITAAHQCTDPGQLREVVEAIKQAAEATEQKSMGIRGTSRFYILPRQELLGRPPGGGPPGGRCEPTDTGRPIAPWPPRSQTAAPSPRGCYGTSCA